MTRPLEDVQDEILDRVHAGEVLDREGILTENPDHAEALGAFFEVLDLVEGTSDEIAPALAKLGEFRIIREIGRGGMGRVYEAEQTSLKRRVALKVLPPSHRLDARLVSRFRREAEAAGRLRHPGIVPVFSVGEVAGTPFFAMELVDGVSLQQILETRRAGDDAGLPTESEAYRRWAVETAAKVADALAYAHGQGILHRDVKPANILLDASGEPRLTDFGLAQDLRLPGLTQAGEVFGSPQYMSPEQALRRDAPMDERTDVYSLGVTLYELLTLRLPYAGSSPPEVLTALLAGEVVPPRTADPAMPEVLEQVLLGALRRDPGRRYPSTSAFADDLRAVLAGEEPAHRPPPSQPRVQASLPPPSRRRVWIPLAAAAAVLLAILGLAVVLGASMLVRHGREAADARGGAEAVAVAAAEEQLEQAVEDAAVEQARVADADSAERVLDEYRALGANLTLRDYEVAIERLRSLDSERADEVLRTVYEGYIESFGKDDPEARAYLGYREFPHEVPEVITYRRYPHTRAVEVASQRRWFGPDEEESYRLAEQAWWDTQRHAELLRTDARSRALNQVLSNIGLDPNLGAYHASPLWAGPFLICHLGSAPSSPYDESALLAGELRAAPAVQASERQRVAELLTTIASVLAPLSEEYLARYGEALGLKPLMDPWGGRPDFPRNIRSFEDGAPLVVVVLERRDEIGLASLLLPPGVHAFFRPTDSTLHFVVEDDLTFEGTLAEGALIHEAVHALQHWYQRQRARWGRPASRQSWFDEGLADYFAGVRQGSDGSLEFVGLNRLRVRGLQSMQQALQARGEAYPFFPLNVLVAFRTYHEVMQWATGELGLPGGTGFTLFHQQAWALTYFLNHGADGRYREGFVEYANSALEHGQGTGWQEVVFRKALGLDTEEAFRDFEAAFEAYVRDHLMKLDVGD